MKMKITKRDWKENLVYVALWLLLFIVPMVTEYVRAHQLGHGGFPWHEVLSVWRIYAIYLFLFLIHNYLLAPLLIRQHKKVLYFSFVGVMAVAFIVYQCQSSGGVMEVRQPHGGPPHREMLPERSPYDDVVLLDNDTTMRGMMPPEAPPDGMKPPGDRHHPEGEMPPDGRHGPMGPFGLVEVFSVLVLLLMVGMNLGIKLYFKADEDAKEMRELEKKSLEQQLAYLKYQINPHFFMNTLNNIHALVDIDPEKSKETILILSKIMRYVLYEGDKSIIPLQREIAFMNNYIDLMRIRYTDKVKIEVEAPEHLPDVGIPPLLLITFVENAFKHGVSYQQDSLIHIKVGIDHERLKFVCRNTKTAEPNKEKKQGGVGLANVKQRLELLYGKNFTLDLEDGADSYEVMLLLPLERIEG